MSESLTIEALTPSIVEVSALMRARTTDVNGSEFGIFNDETRPTNSQVAALAVTAAADLQARLGPSPPVGVEAVARGAAAVLAAMMIEVSFFPEHTQSGRSGYEQLRDLFESRMSALTAWASEAEPGGQRVSSGRVPVLGRETIEDGIAVPVGRVGGEWFDRGWDWPCD